jgi:hypothetical protein
MTNIQADATFTIDNKTYVIDWDGDHYGDIQITEDDYNKFIGTPFEKYLRTNDEGLFLFDLGGIVLDKEEGLYIDEDEVGKLFGFTPHPDYNGLYGNG